MSGLSMRTRIIAVVSSAAVIAPFALMGGSAHAADLPVDPAGLPVVSGLLGGAGGAAGLAGPGLGPVDGVLGTATGLLGVTEGLPVVGGMTEGVGADSVTETLPLGSLVDLDVLKTVTTVADLTKVLGTVTKLVNLDEVLKNVTKLVDLNHLLNLDKLLNLPVKINSPAVKGGAKDAQSRRSTVKAGELPHTGGNADMTALLLCAGLAVAGTGVTMVTRRRNALGMASA